MTETVERPVRQRGDAIAKGPNGRIGRIPEEGFVLATAKTLARRPDVARLRCAVFARVITEAARWGA